MEHGFLLVVEQDRGTRQVEPIQLRDLKYEVVCWIRRQITWDTDLWEESKPQTVCNWSTGHRTGDKTQNSRIRIHGSSSLYHPGILIGNRRNKCCLLEAKKGFTVRLLGLINGLEAGKHCLNNFIHQNSQWIKNINVQGKTIGC